MNSDLDERVEGAIEAAFRYVLSKQQSEGCWVDWDLPPGESSVWTTAYVGCKLRSLPTRFKQQAAASTRNAADWLSSRMFPDFGWGYNELTGSDADSTALAIQILTSTRRTVPQSCYTFLLNCQVSDGGFSTFRGQSDLGSWADSHTDVTPAAILAILPKHGRTSDPVRHGLEFLVKKKTSTGIWQSFWWTSFLYATEASLALLEEVEVNIDLRATKATLLASRPMHPFECSLLIASLLALPGRSQASSIYRLVEELIGEQQADGSWRSLPMLRVSHRDCREPWKSGDPDSLFCDKNNLFTTATAIYALSKKLLSQRFKFMGRER